MPQHIINDDLSMPVHTPAIQMNSKTLTPTKSSLGVTRSVRMAGSRASYPQSDQVLTTVANNLLQVVNCLVYILA